jgi:LmbE family N-acetylglucosaminyl deacetylase
VTTVFVSPHPDDIALSCGGLVAHLRARGEAVAIVTVFCGPGPLAELTPYQRLALGFGSREKWQPGVDQADAGGGGAPAARAADVDPGEPDVADAEASGAVPTTERLMAVRRAEDESFARFVGASVIFLGLPDAVFRGYEGDPELLGEPRPDDRPPVAELRRAIVALEPEALYLPFSIGGHVDHRQARRAATALLAEPGSPLGGRARFYEDFPYALNHGFERLDQLDPEIVPSLPPGAGLVPEYLEVADMLDRKLAALRCYESQLFRLFGGAEAMAAAVRERAARVGELGGIGPAERYWRLTAG